MNRLFAAALLTCGIASHAASQTVPARAGATATTADQRVGSVRALMRVGEFRVDVLGTVHPPRMLELTTRFQAAMQRKPAFWQQYIRERARPGEPLPYDTAMGLSRPEYEELLRLAGETRTAKVSEATLTIRAVGENRYEINGGSELPELTGIVIDLGADQVRTAFGTSTERGVIEPSERQATGPWAGVSWKHESLDASASEGSTFSFALGRLEGSRRGILYFDAKRMAAGRLTGRATRLLSYDLPEP